MRPYPRTVAKKDTPEPYEAVPSLLRDMLSDEGPVMVTTWVVVCEYVDEQGSPGFAAWSSDDPPWRVQGLISHGADMLDLAMSDYTVAADDEDD